MIINIQKHIFSMMSGWVRFLIGRIGFSEDEKNVLFFPLMALMVEIYRMLQHNGNTCSV